MAAPAAVAAANTAARAVTEAAAGWDGDGGLAGPAAALTERESRARKASAGGVAANWA